MQITKSFTGYFGRCLRCMRQSLIVALLATATAVLSWWAAGTDAATLAFAVTAAGLTSLWLSHLVAFAVRATRAQAGPRESRAKLSEDAVSRRQFGAMFARAIFGVAVLTALPAALVGPAYAAKPCDGCEQYSGQQKADCCLCKYNNCTAGCGNDNACVNKCLKTYNAC